MRRAEILSLLFLCSMATAQGLSLNMELKRSLSRGIAVKKWVGFKERRRVAEEEIDVRKPVTGNSRKLLNKISSIQLDFDLTSKVSDDSKRKELGNGGMERRSLYSMKKKGGVGEEYQKFSSNDPLPDDLVDIAGMDYSPARRKTPIHN
ncbi:hypothetical protein AMTRI_Chr13g123440 [Amborella trichopoda]